MWVPGRNYAQLADRGEAAPIPVVSPPTNALPIAAREREILYAVETSSVVILAGETGSGKTTQTPQFLYKANFGRIVVTQPRRIAAITVAERVAQEMGVRLGHEVGYAVRFEEKWDEERTMIKFCTDGMLVRETMSDPLLSRYDVIMLDEAHERNLETDILFGLIKKILRKRPELRVIVASATLDIDSFIRYFTCKRHEEETKLQSALAISVQGRQYPVDVLYLESPCGNYLQSAIDTIMAIHSSEPSGDILVFLPGQEEIEYVIERLNQSTPPTLLPMAFYGSLPVHVQQAVFEPSPSHVRKAIIATTIAETSVTIPGVAYVIDSCFVKLPFFNPLTGVEALVTTVESKAAAKQRTGRAGRVRPGKCFRLVTEETYKTKFPKHTIPQIQRVNLAPIVLHLLSMGIHDIVHFDFISPPSAEALFRALEVLYSLGAIDKNCLLIEPIGTYMAEFPVDPFLSRMLLASFDFGCTEEALTVACMLSVEDVFINPRGSKERKAKVAECIADFAHPQGDHWTYFKIYTEFIENDANRQWCDEHCLSYRILVRAMEIRKQLLRYVKRFGSQDKRIQSCGENPESLLRCIVAGYFANAAKLHGSATYRTIKDGRIVHVHPTSVLNSFLKSPEWIIFHQSVLTTEEYIREISSIDPRWLIAAAPDFYQCKDVSAVVSGSSGQ
ncbi:pre-mRNA-splicing factor ATP-dependent RNA helicase, partial [Thraustotheca clavata]